MSYKELFREKYSGDNLISIATVDSDGLPWVRTVNATFFGDSFFCGNSGKFCEDAAYICISKSCRVSGDWFSVHGIAQNLGYIMLPNNSSYAAHIRNAFSD